MSSWSKDSFPSFYWPKGTYFYCSFTYSASHYSHAFIQDLPVNAYNSFFPVLPYASMPTKDAKYWNSNMVNYFPADTVVPAFLPSSDHSPSLFYAKLSQTRCPSLGLCAPFDKTNPPYLGGIQASVSASFLLTHLVVTVEVRFWILTDCQKHRDAAGSTRTFSTRAVGQSWQALIEAPTEEDN